MSENVVIQSIIAHYGEANGGEFCANALCVDCSFRWVAIAPWNCDLSLLECPRCHACNCEAEIVVTDE